MLKFLMGIVRELILICVIGISLITGVAGMISSRNEPVLLIVFSLLLILAIYLFSKTQNYKQLVIKHEVTNKSNVIFNDNKGSPLIYIVFGLIILAIIVNIVASKTNQPLETENNSQAIIDAHRSSSIHAGQKVQPQAEVTNPQDKVADHAVSPITRSQYPKTYAAWGAKGVSRINRLLKPAALYVAKSPSCDQVDYIDLSNNRSSPPNKIVLFADCQNGQRFYVSEDDLKNNSSAKSKQEQTRNISDADAIGACIDNTQASLKFPSSFDQKILSTVVFRPDTGNVVVTFDFDAKNGMGNVIPQKARCVIDDRGINPPEISNR